TLLFFSRPISLNQLLLAARRHRVVVAERHGVGPLPPGQRLEARLVLGDLCERHESGDGSPLAGQRVVAVDPGPLGGKVTGDVADGARGTGNLEMDDGLEDDGVGLVYGIEEGLATGRYESNFLRVDGMMFAVVHGDADVLQGKPVERAFAEHLPHALLHRRYELSGDGAAHHVVHELEAGAAL